MTTFRKAVLHGQTQTCMDTQGLARKDLELDRRYRCDGLANERNRANGNYGTNGIFGLNLQVSSWCCVMR
jgi:hypothetical protein